MRARKLSFNSFFHSAAVAFALALMTSCPLQASAAAPASSPASCAEMSWQSCAILVKRKLDGDLANDPAAAIKTVNAYWVPAFDRAYRKLGNPNRLSDLDKIEAEIKGRIDAVQWAEDVAIDALLKLYLPRVAAFAAFLSSAPVQGTMVFLWPSQIGSDAKELQLVNDSIQKRLLQIVRPELTKQDFDGTYLRALREADPQFDATIRKP